MSWKPTPALQRAFPAAAVLVMVAILVGRVDTLILAVPFIVWLVWALMSKPAADTARVELSPRGRVVVSEGEAFEWTMTAAEGGIVSAAWQAKANVTIVGDSAVGEGRVSGELHPASWGRYGMGSPVVAVTDPSGGWRAAPAMPPLTITVTPGAETLDGDAEVRRPLGISGTHTSKHRGSGSALATVREFQPGDRLRQLHWRITARTGRPHVVATHSDRDTDVLMVIDTLSEVADAKKEQTSLDVTVRAMSSIAQHYVRLGDRVGLHDLGTWMGSVPTGTGQRQAIRILDAGSRTDRTRRPASQLVKVPRLPSGTLVFVISPLLDVEVLNEVVRLRHLGGEVVCVDVLPEGAGSIESLRKAREGDVLPEALVLLRAQRDRALVRLQEMGIPVVEWAGPGSLATVLHTMGVAHHAPRSVS